MRHWLRLAGAWVNMALVVAVREDGAGRLRLELPGASTHDPAEHPLIARPDEIALVRAYLHAAAFAPPADVDFSTGQAVAAPARVARADRPTGLGNSPTLTDLPRLDHAGETPRPQEDTAP